MEQEIIDYILQAQRHGLADFEIKQNLLNVGWDANAVEQSFIFAKAAETHSGASGALPPESKTSQGVQMQSVVEPVAHTGVLIAPVALSDGHFGNNAPVRFFKKPIVWINLAVLILLGGGAYGYYSLVLGNPTTVWQKFSQAASSPIYQTKFDFSYSDPGEYSVAGSPFLLKDIKLGLTGSGYVNAENVQNPESNSKIQYTFSSGNTSFSTGFEYILQNKILFLNVGVNPILDMVSSAANDGKKIDWLKIDFAQLQNQASGSPDEAKFYQQLTNPDFKNQLQKIWADAKIIKVDKYIGREKINGVTTLHFKNSADKEAVKGLVNQYVQQLAKAFKGTGSELKDSDVATINEITSQIVDKIQVKEFDTWVGLTDFKLYRVHLVTNAPSVISLAKNSSSFSMPESNDAKRIADVRQMASALELYYNVQSGYPDGSGGNPLDLTPNYLGLISEAPPADGVCNDFYNKYWYQPMGNKKIVKGKTVYDSYQMTFCLGADTGAYKAGIAKLTPGGISDDIPCPGSAEHCALVTTAAADPNAAIEQQVKDFISKLDFSAVVTANADYTDYGKKVQLTQPSNAFDLLQKYQQTQTLSNDAKRLADVRQMASALELYFNDKNSYPDSLQKLTPSYIGVIPMPPAATPGLCSDKDNSYTYKLISPTKYQLAFCISNATGGYSAGIHTLSEAGIQ